ncbi:MAG: DNA repair protein RadC, partial [Polaribacter sp.]
KGGITATMVDVRLLFKKAVELATVGIIVCHNHPSEKLTPSKSDEILTQKIKEAGQTLDIKLLDHLIITQKDYFSFADSQML